MSENKQKEASNAASASKTPSKGAKHVCGKLKSIFQLVSEVKDDPTGFYEHEAIVADRDALKKQLAEKEQTSKQELDQKDQIIQELRDEIDVLKTAKDSLWADHDKRFADFVIKTSNYEDLRNELEEVQGRLAESYSQQQDIKLNSDAATKILDTCKAELDKKNAELEDLKHEFEMLDLELRTSKKREKNLTETVGLQRLKEFPLEGIEASFEDLAVRCHQLASDFFMHSISDDDLDSVDKEITFPPGLYLSSSDTLAARLVRCALAESIIANAIAYHIFAEIPFPQQRNVQWSVRAVLDLFGPLPPNRQNIVRCQLLAEHAEEQNNELIQNAAIENAVRECCSNLRSLMTEDFNQADFKSQLRTICKMAMKTWSPLKWHTSRIVADSVPNRNSWIEADYDSDKIVLSESDEQEKAMKDPVPLLQLFPRILRDNKVLYDGFVLVSTNRAVFASKKASKRHAPSGIPNGHAKPLRSRNDSLPQSRRQSWGMDPVNLRSPQQRTLSRSGTIGPLQSPPTSPTADRRNGV